MLIEPRGAMKAHIVRVAATAHRAWPRGATPRPRSEAEARRPHARGAAAKRSYPMSEVRAAAERARLRQRRSGQEELPHVQGAVAAWALEGLEELFHIQGQWRQQ